jgi:hypothetical protein
MIIDIGTLRRAGYVGKPARNWWKLDVRVCLGTKVILLARSRYTGAL